MTLPFEFEERMKALLGEEYGAFYEALCNEDDVKGLRVNTAKVTAESFLSGTPFDLQPLSHVEGGFIVAHEAQAGKHPYHHAGVYYMQDPGAMASVAAIPTSVWEKPQLRILDLCAAPGGKTTQLAALAPDGVVLANEYVASRSRILSGNVERMGLSNVCVTNVDSKYLAAWYPSYFDLVVVDAPCSGEGMYRKNELAISEWSLQNVQACAKRQTEILNNAAQNVADGGYLLYSTCTYSTEENEAIVAALLDRDPTFALCPVSPTVAACTADGIDITGGERPELKLCRRFYPHRSAGEGQFVALLRKSGEGARGRAVKDAAQKVAKADRSVVEEFCRACMEQTPEELLVCGGNIASFPAHGALDFPLPPFGVVSVGAMVGEVRKGRMVPHHHLFTAYGMRFLRRCVLNPEDARAARYLAGEEIEAGDVADGYVAVCLAVGDAVVTLGGGKVSGGKLKNHYPKGLRTK